MLYLWRLILCMSQAHRVCLVCALPLAVVFCMACCCRWTIACSAFGCSLLAYCVDACTLCVPCLWRLVSCMACCCRWTIACYAFGGSFFAYRRHTLCALPLAVVFCMACCCRWTIACSASGWFSGFYLCIFGWCKCIRHALPLAVSVLHGLRLQVDNCMLCLWLCMIRILHNYTAMAGPERRRCLWQLLVA